jgi:predicted small lipoprotein YifL
MKHVFGTFTLSTTLLTLTACGGTFSLQANDKPKGQASTTAPVDQSPIATNRVVVNEIGWQSQKKNGIDQFYAFNRSLKSISVKLAKPLTANDLGDGQRDGSLCVVSSRSSVSLDNQWEQKKLDQELEASIDGNTLTLELSGDSDFARFSDDAIRPAMAGLAVWGIQIKARDAEQPIRLQFSVQNIDADLNGLLEQSEDYSAFTTDFYESSGQSTPIDLAQSDFNRDGGLNLDDLSDLINHFSFEDLISNFESQQISNIDFGSLCGD